MFALEEDALGANVPTQTYEGDADVADSIRWVGLDVHVHESTIAILDQGTGELMTRRFLGRPHQLMPLLRQIGRPARMVYEAGPNGYGLARRALAEGIDMAVCAPGHTERPPDEHVKTDKRDAIRLARRLASGELVIVAVPSIEQEQLRDLVRCREDIRGDLMRARHRLGKFLLRREIHYEGPHTAWSRKHRAWLASLRFEDRASQLTLADYLHGHDVLVARRDQLDRELCQLAVDSSWAQTVARLGCLRGIATLSAIGLCAEVGRFDRFLHPDPLAAYLGLVSCENTSGERRRQGAITKAGSTHARRLLVEAAYHYQRHPAVGQVLERRQRDQPAEIINIAWRAQRRLHARWRQLKHARGKANGIVAVAIARELVGFCWEIATWEKPVRTASASVHAGGRHPRAGNPRPAEAKPHHTANGRRTPAAN
jgi:transposase